MHLHLHLHLHLRVCGCAGNAAKKHKKMTTELTRKKM
jgi:hypothetical protein